MLKLRKGAVESVMPREVWFALGIAHELHSRYNLPDLVVTDFEKDDPDGTGRHPSLYVAKLRTRDMREFDASHFYLALANALTSMGLLVCRDVQHIMIQFKPEHANLVHAVETKQPTEAGGKECQSAGKELNPIPNPAMDR